METPEAVVAPETVEAKADTNGADIKGGKLDDVVIGGPIPQLVSDVISTVAATEGASTTMEYVASGIGAAIQAVVGVDPINPVQVRAVSHYPSTTPVSQNPTGCCRRTTSCACTRARSQERTCCRASPAYKSGPYRSHRNRPGQRAREQRTVATDGNFCYRLPFHSYAINITYFRFSFNPVSAACRVAASNRFAHSCTCAGTCPG